MSKQAEPQLTRQAERRYHCSDIPALHEWLEAHGYQFYGQHNPDEYGRFSHQEAHDQGGQRAFVHSFIQVLNNGEVYSPDPSARSLLDSLLANMQRERSA